MKIFYVLLLVILITGCAQLSSEQNEQGDDLEQEASYVDYINVGDKHYIHAWELVLVDTAGISEIGVVERGLHIQEGTPVYGITGYPEHEVIAVKTDSNKMGLVNNTSCYLIYVQHGDDKKSYYPKIQDQPVKEIKIYRGSKLLRELKGTDMRSFLELFNQEGPHNEFLYDKSPEYTVMFLVDNALGYNYGIMEKDGQYGLTHIESKLPDEMARYFK